MLPSSSLSRGALLALVAMLAFGSSLPAQTILMDDGDTGFTAPGWTSVMGMGNLGDATVATTGNGSLTATWTFNGLTPGVYRVSATWVPHPNRPTDARYTILNGSLQIASSTKNQEIAPDDLTESGVAWENLGDVSITGSTLAVRLTNQSSQGNQTVMADTIRIQRLANLPAAQEIQVLNGTANVADGSTTAQAFGTTLVGTPVTRTFTVRNLSSSTTPLTLTQPISVPAGFSASNFGATSLGPNASTTFTVTLTATAPGSFSGQVSFGNNDADENPFNFAISGTVNQNSANGPQIIDDQAPFPPNTSFTLLTSVWGTWPVSNAYNGHAYFAFPVGGADTQMAQWQATNLPAGTYTIQATWPFDSATNVEYRMFDGATLRSTAFVDQSNHPTGPTFGGRPFQTLGSITVNSGTLRVVILSNTSGYVMADAIRFSPNVAFAPEIEVLDNGTNIADNTGTAVNFGNTLAGMPITKTFTVRNTGFANLTLTPPITVPAGFTVTSSFGSTTLAPNASTTFTVQLNATTAGTFSGQLSFANSDSNENPFNFPITGLVVAPGPEIQVLFNNTNIPNSTGSVTFGTTAINVPVLRTIMVRNLGTQDLTLTAPITVPSGFTVTQSFGSPVLGPGVATTFVVRLDAAALGNYSGQVSFANNDTDENPFTFNVSGTVVVAGPEIVVRDGLNEVADNTGSVVFPSTQQFLPITRSFTVSNIGTSDLVLTPPISVPAGFSVAASFGTTTVAPGGQTTFQLRLDANSVGTFSGSVSFGTNDSDENPFNFNISGTVNPRFIANIIDDRDPGFTRETEVWGTWPVSNAYNGHAYFAFPVGGEQTQTARWQATNLPPLNYKIQYTWPFDSATNVRLDIFDGPTLRQTAFVDQTQNPVGPTFGNRPFQTIAESVQISSGTLTVRIYSNTSGYVMADAVRYESVTGAATPEIAVLDQATNIPDNTGVVNFGSTLVGTPISKTFTVQNQGSAPLTLTPPISVPAGFTVTSSFGATSIPAGGQTTFTVRLDATASGSFSGQLSFDNNDSDENPFNFTINGTVNAPAPEITVLDGPTNVPDNTGNVNFGSTTVGTAVSKTFTVRNDGTAALTLSTPITVPAGFTVTSSFGSTSLAPNASTTFTVQLDAAATGTFSGELSFGNNDNDENPFNFTISGVVNAVAAPEIQVLDNGTDIPDNTGSVSYASTTVGTPVSKTFTVRNNGNANLTLTPPITVPAGFTLTATFGSTTLAPNATTTFTVRLDAASAGTFTGQVSFGNNDSDENPFNFQVSGTVNAVPVPEIQVLVDGNTDIPDNTGSVNFGTTNQGTAVSRTFTVRNIGTANLSLTSAVTVPAGFSVPTTYGSVPVTVPVGGQVDFTVRLDATAPGTFSGQLSFNNNDSDENPFNFTISGTVVAPEIQVLDGATNIPDGTGSVSFGTTTVGTPVVKTFTVRNIGTADLTLIPPINVPSGFTVTSPFGSTSLAPNAQTTFTVQLDGSPVGTPSGQLSFGNNDSDENPFNFTISGTVNPAPQPEIEVLDGATDIADGVGSVNYGATTVGTPISKTFTVRNIGTANLTLSTPITVPSGYTLTATFGSTTLAPSASTTFTVRLDAGTQGTFTGQVSFGNNDLDENPFNFQVTGQVNAVSSTVFIIDDGNPGDPGFSTSPNGPPWVLGASDPGGFGGDTTSKPASGNGDTATWAFTGLTPGTYRVAVRWTAAANRSPAAPYSIWDGPAGGPNPLTFFVDQRIAPNGFTDAGFTWEELATISISNTSLTVQLQDLPGTTGMLIADAARIELITVNTPTDADAVRFLEQATWGPKPSTITDVRAMGFDAWLARQFSRSTGSNYALNRPFISTDQATGCPTGSPATCVRDNYTPYLFQKQFYKVAMYNEDDQLRQRVAFALHKILVSSTADQTASIPIYRYEWYLRLIDQNALGDGTNYVFNGQQFPRGNFRTLLLEMTLNPSMGDYLDMKDSTRINLNENYAREIMQLFSIGLFMLNQDGTLQMSGSPPAPIDTYTQADIVALARIFTGWNLAAPVVAGTANYRDPMVQRGVNAQDHDFVTPRPTLFGFTWPTRTQSVANANLDLIDAINLLFNHPNVGPFIGKGLIQQLVTSNPSPAYVSRVAAVFNGNDNGLTGASRVDAHGVRGDMKSVIAAILKDPEARGDHKDANVSSSFMGYGKLREPVQWQLNILRMFNATSFGNLVGGDGTTLSDGVLAPSVVTQNQNVFAPPTVFSYFVPDEPFPAITGGIPPGCENLKVPEFGTLTSISAFAKANFIETITGASNNTNPPANVGLTVANPDRPNGTSLNLTSYLSMSNTALLDEMNRLTMHGRMSMAMRNQLETFCNSVDSNPSIPAGLKQAKKVRGVVYLIANSSQYQVQQ